MSNLLCKEAGYEGSSLAKAGGVITITRIEKVYQWCKCDMASIGAGVCMLLLSPFYALLVAVYVLLAVIVTLDSLVRYTSGGARNCKVNSLRESIWR
jgi:hypothetical protein